MNDINKAINHLIMLKRLDSGEKKDLYDLAIKALQKELNNGWTLCSEKLPEQRQYKSGELIEYNVMLRYGVVATTACINQDGIWGDMCWETDTFHPIGSDVIAWQPLPEPLRNKK